MVALSDPGLAAGRWTGWPIFFLAVANQAFARTCALIAAQSILS